MDYFQARRRLKGGKYYFALRVLEERGMGAIRRLPVSIRILLESLLRHCDGHLVHPADVEALAQWGQDPLDGKKRLKEVPFIVSRVLLQDFTGVPLLVDLAAMRDAMAAQGWDPKKMEPSVPVDLVVDHSVQVDRFGSEEALRFNQKVEWERNQQRYSFLKWGEGAFTNWKVIPPGVGICHQVNLEYLASVVVEEGGVVYPDTVVGTDSHTPMVNGLGVVGWGVGGIEAEAAIVGQPVCIPMPQVVGVHLKGVLREGVTATDLALRITELLRKENVVGTFVEFFGEGTKTLSVADRATLANMAPEYGATMGFFPCDEKTLEYLRLTGRSQEQIEQIQEYLVTQDLFGISSFGEIDYTKVVELALDSIVPCVAGPKRPQDRIDISQLSNTFAHLLAAPLAEGGYGISARETLTHGSSTEQEASPLQHGSIVLAAITSCTNTSNPSVMIGAALVAKKAVEYGMTIPKWVKTSLAPGSRVVTDYLCKSGLQIYLDKLGFQVVAYGCTTCIGNSGPLEEGIERAIAERNLVVASVLSGNRNFEARIHSSVKANFLMSPPLVVAYALAGRIDIDLSSEAIGMGALGNPVFLKDLWPSSTEIQKEIERSIEPKMFRDRYARIRKENEIWDRIEVRHGVQYPWDEKNTYIQRPPYFDDFTLNLPAPKLLKNMRALAIFGDCVTTDHLSPAGAFSAQTPAGHYLQLLGVRREDFNSYGSRRGNHHVMIRGTCANVRIHNQMARGKEGGYTRVDGEIVPIFEASQRYAKTHTPLLIFAGKEYGMGSSRDWAAKGTALLGVVAVIAESFERIHRSNLIGMGVLPLEFLEGTTLEALALTGDELFSIEGMEAAVHPRVVLSICYGGATREIPLVIRLDTPIEVEYYRNGGIMPYILRQMGNQNLSTGKKDA